MGTQPTTEVNTCPICREKPKQKRRKTCGSAECFASYMSAHKERYAKVGFLRRKHPPRK